METFEKESFETEKQTKLGSLKSVQDSPNSETTAPMLPPMLRYVMLGLLVAGICGAVVFAFVRQNSIKPVANKVGTEESCTDPVTENRLRDTLSKSPNDFATLMDWGDYNVRCRQPADYASAISAYQNAARLADNPGSNMQTETRIEAHMNLGLAHLYNGNFKAAQTEFKQILNEQPKNTFVLLALGGALVKENPQEALVYLQQVVTIAPNTKIAENAQLLISDIKQGGARTTPVPGTAKV